MARPTIKELEAKLIEVRSEIDEANLRNSRQAITIAKYQDRDETARITVAEHMADCKQFSDVLDNANALTSRAKTLLSNIRESLGVMKPAQHDLVKVRMPYHLKHGDVRNDEVGSCSMLIGRQIKQIDVLLGDRA